jgi:AraC-like DNA-binding protein
MNISALTHIAKRFEFAQSTREFDLPRVSLFVQPNPAGLQAYIYEPVLCLILQGGKEVISGNQRVDVRQGDALLVSHHLPVLSRITEASAEKPYMALILSIDLQLVRSLYSEVGLGDSGVANGKSLAAGPAQSQWVEPLTRYLDLFDKPIDARVLGPALLREIHYRLLTSTIGAMLQNLLLLDSHASRIAKATYKLRNEFRMPIAVASLAKEAGMSPTAFHEHFKEVTGTTPLQYQKDLRLTEARNLLLNTGQKVAEAAFAVGYESPAQFSRDFSRKFGSSPRDSLMRDVQVSG